MAGDEDDDEYDDDDDEYDHGDECTCECDVCEGNGCNGSESHPDCEHCTHEDCPGCPGAGDRAAMAALSTTDGCRVMEAGQRCQHGHVSWLRWYGVR